MHVPVPSRLHTCVKDSSGLPSVISFIVYCSLHVQITTITPKHIIIIIIIIRVAKREFVPAALCSSHALHRGPPGCALPSRRKHHDQHHHHHIRQSYRRHSLPAYSLPSRHCCRRLRCAIVSTLPQALPVLHKRWLGCAITEALGHSNGISGARATTSLESEARDNRFLFSTIATELSHV